MATITWATGFEHKIAVASGGTVVALDKRLWSAISGTPTIETSIVHHGNAALRCAGTAAACWVRRSFTAGKRRKIYSYYVRFVTLPSAAACRTIQLAYATAGATHVGVTTGGVWYAIAAGGTQQNGPAASTGVWYRVDVDINASANPHTVDWKIDGVAQTQAVSGSVAAEDFSTVQFGSSAAATTDVIIDCAVESETAADFPLGEYKILGYKPNADTDITQVGAGAFVDAAAAAISGANPAWDNLLSPEDATAATRVEQTAIDAAGYIKVGFEDSSESTDPAAVTAIAVMRADSTTATNGQVKVDDGGTLDAFTGLFDPSEATNVNVIQTYATKPSGGAWTDTAFDALQMRFGFSTDANPDTWFSGLMFEAVFAVAAAAADADPFPFVGGGYFPVEG